LTAIHYGNRESENSLLALNTTRCMGGLNDRHHARCGHVFGVLQLWEKIKPLKHASVWIRLTDRSTRIIFLIAMFICFFICFHIFKILQVTYNFHFSSKLPVGVSSFKVYRN